MAAKPGAAENEKTPAAPVSSAVAPVDWTSLTERPKLEGCGNKGTDCEE